MAFLWPLQCSVLKDTRKGGRPSKYFGFLLGVFQKHRNLIYNVRKGVENSPTGAFHLTQDSWDRLTSARRPELGLNTQRLTFWYQVGERNSFQERTSQSYLKTCKSDGTLTRLTKRGLGQTVSILVENKKTFRVQLQTDQWNYDKHVSY